MLRSALLAAVFLLPSTAMADKIVNPDGDSFVEVSETEVLPGRADSGLPSWTGTLSILGQFNPVSSANAQTLAAPSEARPAADVPEMKDPFLDIEAIIKPDYSAESFR